MYTKYKFNSSTGNGIFFDIHFSKITNGCLKVEHREEQLLTIQKIKLNFMDIQNINICDKDIRFEFTISIPPLSISELKGYVEKFECQVLYSIYDDDDDSEGYEKVIGKLYGYRFSLYSCYRDYCEDKEDTIFPLDILDMIDDNVAKLLSLFDDDCDVKAKYRRKLESIFDPNNPGSPNIVLINRVEVLAEYRGRKFGEALISNSLYTIGRKNDLVIVDYMPLQLAYKDSKEPNNEWDEEMRLNELEQDKEIARNKLKKYYKKLGFKLLNKEGLLFLII